MGQIFFYVFNALHRPSKQADCILCKGERLPPPKRFGTPGYDTIMNMRRFGSGVLESEEYPLIVITPRSTLTGVVVSVRACSIAQIDLFKDYLYKIGILDAI